MCNTQDDDQDDVDLPPIRYRLPAALVPVAKQGVAAIGKPASAFAASASASASASGAQGSNGRVKRKRADDDVGGREEAVSKF